MSRRFSDRPVTDSTPLTPDVMNSLIVPLDAAIEALEAVRFSWEEQIAEFNSKGLKRISDALKPLLTQIQAAISGSLLAATTDDFVALVEGETTTFFIPPAARVAFLPSPFLSITAPDVLEDWAQARLVSYDNITGLLRAEILHLGGSGAARSGWTISDNAGVVEAIQAWLEETLAAKNEATEKAGEALASKNAAASNAAASLTSQTLAAGSASDAAAQKVLAAAAAAAAATSASAAAASAASIAGGPVTSVAGLTGVILESALKSALSLNNVDNTSDATKNSAVATLTNKTIAGGSNTISGLTLAMFAANVFDTDTSLAANSNTRAATQAAVKAYIDGIIEASNALQFKNTIACAANPNYPAANAGHMYIVSSAGKIGGASGLDVEIGDALICKTDGSTSGSQASVGANWTILQFNLVGALTAASIGATVQAFSAVLDALAAGVTMAPGTLTVKGTSSSAGGVSLAEDTDNGTNSVTLRAPASLSASPVFNLPGADGSPGQFMKTDGAGNLSFANTTSALVLLSSQPFSGVTSVSFTTGITTDYDHYIFDLIGVTLSTTSGDLSLLVSANGGSSYLTTGYSSAKTQLSGTTALAGGISSGDLQLGLVPNSLSSGAMNGQVHLFLHNTGYAALNALVNTANQYTISGTRINATTRVNAVQFSRGGQALTGMINMYGVAKT